MGGPSELYLYKFGCAEGLSAYRGHGNTLSRVGLPANRLRPGGVAESKSFHGPFFRLLQTDLEIIYGEKNHSLDSKG